MSMLRIVVVPLLLVAACQVEPAPLPEEGPPTGMVLIPGQTFMMGTDPGDFPGILQRFGVTRVEMLLPEAPRHSVAVADFFLDISDVTNAAFFVFIEERSEWSRKAADSTLHNGRYLEHWSATGPVPDDLDRPVTFVTWYAAVAYCDWQGKRLPTEAEWELAAGGADADNIFPWGLAPPTNDQVTWSGGEHDGPEPVAGHPSTGPGLYDMAGNVWKFLADEWFDSYADLPAALPMLDPDTVENVRTRRVVRGGSYGASALNMRIQYRDSHRPADAREMVGFRCARSTTTM